MNAAGQLHWITATFLMCTLRLCEAISRCNPSVLFLHNTQQTKFLPLQHSCSDAPVFQPNLDSNQIFPDSGLKSAGLRRRYRGRVGEKIEFFSKRRLHESSRLPSPRLLRPPLYSLCSVCQDSVWDQHAEARLQMRVPVYAEREGGN